MSPIATIIVSALAEPEVRDALRVALGSAPPADERIPLADVVQHGAPSAQWATRRKLARGPRGGRYVLRSDLEALLSTSTIARRKPAASVASTSLDDDAHAAVVNLASRRSRRTG